jgi:hypothetical protein
MRWRRFIVGCIGFALTSQLLLAFIWLDRGPRAGTVETGYFEEIDGQTTLVLNDDRRVVLPAVGITRNDELTIMPGSTAGLPLDASAEYVVSNQQSTIPYVVIGTKESGRLVNALVPVALDGKARLDAWNAAAPWSTDQARLTAVTQACGADKQIRINHGPSIELHIGHCVLTAPRAPSLYVAIIAGPDWVSVNRVHGWMRANRARPGLLIVCALVALITGALLSYSVGPAGGLACGIVLALASLWLPVFSLAGFLLLIVVAWCGCVWKALRPRIKSRKVAIAPWLAIASLPFIGLYIAATQASRSRPPPQ